MAQKTWSQWTKEEVMAEAAKYKKRKDFEKGCISAYRAAKAMNIYEVACAHMNTRHKWTNDKVRAVAAQYTSKDKFRNDPAYKAAIRRGILEEVTAHMEYTKLQNGKLIKHGCRIGFR